MQERIMTPGQVAEILQIHQFTVLKFIRQGRLKASKLGRVYRIRESDLEDFLEQSSSKSSKTAETVTKVQKKSKNKNKISPNQSESEAEDLPEEETTVQVSRVEKIEPAGASTNVGGEDEYYILQ